MSEYDLIIVGAGPGGSVAAKIGAENGLKTLFIERGRIPGEKNSSGCGLGPRIWRDFPELMKNFIGNPKLPSQRPAKLIYAHYIGEDHLLRYTEAWGPSDSVTYWPAKEWIVMACYRSDFDPWLAEFATKAGAELKTSTLVIDLLKDENGKVSGVVTDKGEKINGKVVIGADGVVSTVSRASGLQYKWGKKAVTTVPQIDFSADPKKIDEALGDASSGIWAGPDFPAAYQVWFHDGMHIGFGNWLGWFVEHKNPMSYMNKIVNIPHFQKLCQLTDAKPREIQCHLLPWTWNPVRTHTDNVILVGDAAGFPCPLEAEGVYPAMITGKLAVETAINCISNGDTSKRAFDAYDEAWKKSSVGIEFRGGRSLAEMWRASMFDLDAMKWIIPFNHEIKGAIGDWSQPHIVRLREILAEIRTYVPKLIPFVLSYVLPIMSDVFEDDTEILPEIESMLRKMMPKKK